MARNSTSSGKRAGLPFKDDLPSVSAATMRRAGAITPESLSVIVRFGDLEREIRVTHRLFPARGPQGKRGSWSFFLCPVCDRRARTLRLYDGRVLCHWCDGLMYRCQAHDKANRLERLRQALYGPKPIERRRRLEVALRRALLAERRKWL
jgi:hypothetical protein